VARVGALVDQSPEAIDLMLGVNVRGPWLTVRAVLPLLTNAASMNDTARVVMVGSIGGIRPKAGSGFNSATKAALHVLTGILAVELGPCGVLVNAVALGTVETPMAAAVASPHPPSIFRPSGPSPLGRIAVPEDVADVI
jgi:NAD(P)-dependent dehydrogenase (short-subunit alcohol dehydrogenase family)